MDATTFWDREVSSPTHISWFASPTVRNYVNESISGSPHIWPMEWFERWLAGRRFDRGLSIGCGTGSLERDLLQRGLCRRIDAFDGSPRSIEIATDEAARAGISESVHYYVDDFNEVMLPRAAYDIVFFHQSLHHVAKLEKLLRRVRRSLRRGGLLYLDEYVGPSRTDWNHRSIGFQRAAYELLLPQFRQSANVPLPIQADDPSEAIRSGEIEGQLHIGFDVATQCDYGGNLLAVLFPLLAQQSPDFDEQVTRLIAAERALLHAELASFHAVIVATPKRGWRAMLADAIYFTVPKLKRIGRELAALYRRVSG